MSGTVLPSAVEQAVGRPGPRIFDHHIHSDGRNADDYELMALSGVDTILIPCSTSNERRPSGASFAARFDRLLAEVDRAAHYGVRALVALSVHAADVCDLSSALAGIDELADRLADPRVIAIGELSVRRFTDDEIVLFDRQLRLAGEVRLPVLVELAPNHDAALDLLAVLRRSFDRGVADPARVALMDVTPRLLPIARELGCGGYGLAVAPTADHLFQVRDKLDHRQVLAMVERYGPDGLMLNSGAHFGSADPLGLARTVLRLRLAGLAPRTLDGLAHATARAFFGLPEPTTTQETVMSCSSTV